MADRPGNTAAGAASLPVVGAAGGVFCLALIFLALQMRAGDDPALGEGAEPAVARPVIVRRVVVRRIVTEAPEASGNAAEPAPSAGAAPAPAAAAPPAAPAPAPVTTQAS
jgi:hypothetical protein